MEFILGSFLYNKSSQKKLMKQNKPSKYKEYPRIERYKFYDECNVRLPRQEVAFLKKAWKIVALLQKYGLLEKVE